MSWKTRPTSQGPLVISSWWPVTRKRTRPLCPKPQLHRTDTCCQQQTHEVLTPALRAWGSSIQLRGGSESHGPVWTSVLPGSPGPLTHSCFPPPAVWAPQAGCGLSCLLWGKTFKAFAIPHVWVKSAIGRQLPRGTQDNVTNKGFCCLETMGGRLSLPRALDPNKPRTPLSPSNEMTSQSREWSLPR